MMWVTLAIIRAEDHVSESAFKTDGAVLEVPRSGQYAFSINHILAITGVGIKPFVIWINCVIECALPPTVPT